MEIYDNLMSLCEKSDISKFFYKDFKTLMGTNVRIFSYNYASYTDWLEPDALEARGIMFELDDEANPVRIMSRPMEKFFNLYENPMTTGLDLSTVEYVMNKVDGSLISTFIDNGLLFTKSKGSIFSDQALAANGFFNDFDNRDLYNRATELAQAGFTLNFEYVAPDNRIVLLYPVKELILLNIRNNDTGEYVKYSDIYADPILRRYLVNRVSVDLDNPDWVNQVKSLEGIEGYVVVLNSGQKFKLKTTWYSTLHSVRDSISTNEALFKTIVAGASDDLIAMFSDDEYSVKKINDFIYVHLNFLSKSIEIIQEKYARLAGKDRKTYAVTAQSEFNSSNTGYLFGVFMQCYNDGIQMDTIVSKLNDVFIKNYSLFVPDEYKI